MIIWGGANSSSNWNTGGRYNPSANNWTATTTASAPNGRREYSAVWTDSEMIVWGGAYINGLWNNGGRYNPTGDNWTAVSTAGAPAARSGHTAVWTGSEMLVWGGFGGSRGSLNDTWSYTPSKVLYLYQRP
jgi:hypothetical protein